MPSLSGSRSFPGCINPTLQVIFKGVDEFQTKNNDSSGVADIANCYQMSLLCLGHRRRHLCTPASSALARICSNSLTIRSKRVSVSPPSMHRIQESAHRRQCLCARAGSIQASSVFRFGIGQEGQSLRSHQRNRTGHERAFPWSPASAIKIMIKAIFGKQTAWSFEGCFCRIRFAINSST